MSCWQLSSCYVGIRVAFQPSLAPREERSASAGEILRGAADALPIVVLIAMVIGSMYIGLATPTEASALGCLLAIALALAYHELTLVRLKEALRNAAITSGVVMFITLNAQILNFAVVTTGISHGLASGLAELGLSPLIFFCMLFAIYLVVGMFIDGLSIMLLTVPLLYPSFIAMGFDGIWVGVIMVVFIELGALTPPMGLNLFAIQSIASDRSLGEVATASLPYMLMITVFAFLLYAFPAIALWLPTMMKAG